MRLVVLIFAAISLVSASAQSQTPQTATRKPLSRPDENSVRLDGVGTLVVIVGSAKGLVVAADSRSTFPGIYCDDAFKILIPKTPNRTVVMVTGVGTWVDFKPGRSSDFCMAVRSSPEVLNIGSLVTGYLERKRTRLANLSLTELGSVCVAAMKEAQNSHPLFLQSFVGHDVFLVVMADYDPKAKIASVLNFVVRIDANGKDIQAARFSRETISQADRWVILPFGESDYFFQTVYHGVGRQFIDEAIFGSMVSGKLVREVSIDQAMSAAVNTIEAASRTTAIIPAESGIGGPIDVVLLGSQSRPQKLRWKDQPQATNRPEGSRP